MAKGSIDVRGIKELAKGLKDRANLNDVKNVVRGNGAEMHRKISGLAPVGKTSHLKRSVRIYIEDDGFTAKVVSEAEYAPYQEYGTRFQTGTPHVRPGYHQQRNVFLSDMKRLMK